MKKNVLKSTTNVTKINDLDYGYKIMEFMGELVAGADHEIKNLLMMIDGSSRMLIDDKASPDQKKLSLEVITTKIHRIANIVSDLRAVLKDGSTEKIKQYNVKELMRKAAQLCQKRFTNHKILFKMEISDDLTIDGKETQLIQAILGVLTSSHDSLMHHQARWIRVYVSENINDITITVEDSGDQLSDSDRRNLSNPFYTTKDGRSGIGLAMAKSIVEAHKGVLSLSNTEETPQVKLTLPRGNFTPNQNVLSVPSIHVEEIEVFDHNASSIHNRKVA